MTSVVLRSASTLEKAAGALLSFMKRHMKSTTILVVAFLSLLSATAHAQIHVSYNEAIKLLPGFDMQASKLAGGAERYMGMSPDNGAVLDLVGPKSNLTKASLVIAVPNDSQRVVAQNTGRLLRFIANTVPEWKGSTTWVNANLRKIADGDYSDTRTVVASKRRCSIKLRASRRGTA